MTPWWASWCDYHQSSPPEPGPGPEPQGLGPRTSALGAQGGSSPAPFGLPTSPLCLPSGCQRKLPVPVWGFGPGAVCVLTQDTYGQSAAHDALHPWSAPPGCWLSPPAWLVPKGRVLAKLMELHGSSLSMVGLPVSCFVEGMGCPNFQHSLSALQAGTFLSSSFFL